jgi:hypothetical protein
VRHRAHGQVDATLSRLTAEALDDIGDHRRELGRGARLGLSTRAGEPQETVDQRVDARDGGDRPVHGLLGGRIVLAGMLDQLEGEHRDRQRVQDVVGDAAGELSERLVLDHELGRAALAGLALGLLGPRGAPELPDREVAGADRQEDAHRIEQLHDALRVAMDPLDLDSEPLALYRVE